MMKNVFFVVISTLIFTMGCASRFDMDNDALKNSYKKEIEAYEKLKSEQKPSPSLWTDSGSRGSLFLDYKARHIGDLITINIIETVNASNSISTGTNRSQNTASTGTSILGVSLSKLFGKNKGGTNLSSSNKFTSSGTKAKNDTVTATMAARITQVLPSGNLVVEGHKEIVVDNQDQSITLSGIVREKDISADNTVVSTAIADAKIAYSGSGTLTDANTPGWLMALVGWLMPF